MMETFRRAHAHKGASFVEIYQNCNVFNDGAFEQITGKEHRADMLIPLVHGEPIRFGAEGEHGVVHPPRRLGRGRRGGRRRRVGAARPRRAPRQPRARLPAEPAVAGTLRADPDRRLPRRRPTGLRRSRWPSRSTSATDAAGPGRPRRAAALRARRGRSSSRRSGRPRRRSARGARLGPPTSFVAMLRSINVGGRNRVAMADLRALVTVARLRRRGAPTCRAGTWSSPGAVAPAAAAEAIEARDRRGARPGRCRSWSGAPSSSAGSSTANPFAAGDADPKTLHVTFLAERPGRRAGAHGWRPRRAAGRGRPVRGGRCRRLSSTAPAATARPTQQRLPRAAPGRRWRPPATGARSTALAEHGRPESDRSHRPAARPSAGRPVRCRVPSRWRSRRRR